MLAEIRTTAASYQQRSRQSDAELQAKLDIDHKTRTSLFPWRGQFSPQLIEHLLDAFAGRSTRVLDPFCGGGTVLGEAARKGLPAIGYDINPAAYLLAAMHELSMLDRSEREAAIEDVYSATSKSATLFTSPDIANGLCDRILNLQNTSLLIASTALMLAMGDTKIVCDKKFFNSLRSVSDTVRGMPFTEMPIHAFSLDCRRTPLPNNSIDLIITSPPYINVFNYHQNYRPAIEQLGWRPLSIATSEIGANRKHRQNRFLTVVQYAIDMGMVLNEMHRVLSAEGTLILIVGRCSSVRGISFPNGTMLALVAERLGTFSVASWRERQFLNRFGEQIFEDILILKRRDEVSENDPVPIGRNVGAWALEQGIKHATEGVHGDMIAALEAIDAIMPSRITEVVIPDPFLTLTR